MNGAIETACCIAGGGPAGMMLGYLLARAGVDVVVLEKHGDFLRDFRGDTIHPSTMDLMAELGLLDEFLKLPHEEITKVMARIGKDRVKFADFTTLPTRCKFLAFMPQWDFLDFLADRARTLPSFHLMMRAEATGLIEEGGRVTGVRVATGTGEQIVRAPVTIGADGRHSTIRAAAGFAVEDLGAPMDVLWFRISREAGGEGDVFGHVETGRMMLMLDRGDYWQCAYIIAKGTYAEVEARGIERFRADVATMSPAVAGRVGEIGSWDDVKLLTVAVDRLPKWYRPGLLCIGDAAHAMSPIGGVGINLAIQDAVAAANILAGPLSRGHVTEDDLRAVQERRWFPTRVTQGMQVTIQKRIITPILKGEGEAKAPWLLKMLPHVPLLRRLPGYFVGVGVRPEHIHTGTAPATDSA
jgi:2-polyprenyl-6-methoxyphenol hydroxylase-like FAD-dependent oxidoreductase